MIRVEAGRHELRVTGHAGFHPGNDIVCAGCSALLFALAGALEEAGTPGLGYSLESGDGWVKAKGGEGLFRMAVIGLRQIEKAHPEFVRVSILPNGGWPVGKTTEYTRERPQGTRGRDRRKGETG